MTYTKITYIICTKEYRTQYISVAHLYLNCIFDSHPLPVIMPVLPQLIQINSSVSDGDVLCPGQVISFTCETSGSGTIAWSSHDYIGQGFQLPFSITEAAGGVDLYSTINHTTFAKLLRSEIVGSTPVLKSELTLTVSATFTNPSVTCEHVSNGSFVTRRFQPLGI